MTILTLLGPSAIRVFPALILVGPAPLIVARVPTAAGVIDGLGAQVGQLGTMTP
jgi:hypothetical protein